MIRVLLQPGASASRESRTSLLKGVNGMPELTLMDRDGLFVADSREVAEMIDKRHDHLLRDIDAYVTILNQNPTLGADQFFIADTYQAGTGRGYKHYWLTRKGCDMVANKMIGEKGVLFTATYVTKFEEMERTLSQPRVLTRLELIELARESELARIEAEHKAAEYQFQLQEQAPKVLFADAVTTSHDCILLRELALVLKQNGVNIGQNRLFQQLRERAYLVKRHGSDWNTPTQRSMELGLFEIRETPIVHSDGKVTVSKTPKVTGKGQVYFVNLFAKTLATTEGQKSDGSL